MWKHDKRNNCFEDSAFTVLEFSMGTCGSSWARTMGKEKLPAVWNYTSLFVPNRGMWKKKTKKTTAWGKVEDCIGYGDWTTLHTVHGPASVILVYATVCIAGSMEVKHFSRIARPVRLIMKSITSLTKWWDLLNSMFSGQVGFWISEVCQIFSLSAFVVKEFQGHK